MCNMNIYDDRSKDLFEHKYQGSIFNLLIFSSSLLNIPIQTQNLLCGTKYISGIDILYKPQV